MRTSIFTGEERAVVVFVAMSLAVGAAVLGAGRVVPSVVPEFPTEATQQEADWADQVITGPVNLNDAGTDELVTLPGIGPVRAAAILELRSRRGTFRDVSDLLDVKGIGPATLSRIKPFVTLGGTGDARSDSAAAASPR
jgi:comEA protein